MHLMHSKTYVNIAALFAGILLLRCIQTAEAATFISEPVPREISEPDKNALWTVPVVVIRYIPRSADGTLLDPAKAPNFQEAGKVSYMDKKLEQLVDCGVTHY